MKQFSFLLILLSLFACKKQEFEKIRNSNDVTDGEIYEVVNLAIKDLDKELKNSGVKEEYFKYILDRDYFGEVSRIEDSSFFLKPGTVFSKNDIKYVTQQIKKRRHFRFNQKFISSKIVISSDTIYKLRKSADFFKNYQKRFGNEAFYIFGLPLFSQDKKTVSIRIEGFSEGHTVIYKKESGKWKIYRTGLAWIS